MGKKNAPLFKLTIKDGDTKYAINKTGQYVSKTIDYVEEFDNVGDALAGLLDFVNDPYHDEGVVVLTYTPKKRAKN